MLDETIPARELIKTGSEYFEAKSNVTQDFVASLNFEYEVYKMEKTTVLYTNYVPVYTVAYKMSIHLNDGIDYKGDFLNLALSIILLIWIKFKFQPIFLQLKL